MNIWGDLPKAQDDPTTIDEEIASLIQSHNDDPDAHLGAGQSLYSHKASEIIDHLARSIVSDKLEEFIEIYAKGRLLRDDFHWFTIFESLDGFDFYAGGSESGTIQQLLSYIQLNSGTTTSDFSELAKYLEYYFYDISFSKRASFKTSFSISSVSSVNAWFCHGSYQGAFYGFKIVNNTLYGAVDYDGEHETLVELATISANTKYNVRADFTPGLKVEFYVNDVYIDELTTNLPTGTDYAYIIMMIRVLTNANSNKNLKFSYWDFWIEN